MSNEKRPQRLAKVAGRGPAKAKGPKATKTVVFALYNKVTLQDVAAPLEIFARANDLERATR